jgi:hypothetical protein
MHIIQGYSLGSYLVHIDVQGAQDQDEPAECCVAADGLQPVVIDVEQHHLRLRGLRNTNRKLIRQLHPAVDHNLDAAASEDDAYTGSCKHLQDQVAELLYLQRRLEGQLQLRPRDDNVGEIKQMHLQYAQPFWLRRGSVVEVMQVT